MLRMSHVAFPIPQRGAIEIPFVDRRADTSLLLDKEGVERRIIVKHLNSVFIGRPGISPHAPGGSLSSGFLNDVLRGENDEFQK